MAFYVFLALFLTAVDQLVKLAVRGYMVPDQMINLVPGFVELIHQENKGISFSAFSDLPEFWRAPILAGVSGLVIVGLLVYLKKHWPSYERGERFGFTLILGGAMGNLIDRAFRGSVTDYMYFHIDRTSLFVNNLADDFISVGFVLVLVYSFKGTQDE